MASKKKDGLLGPDGRAVAEAFSGIGQKWNEYTKWRAEREKRIQKKNSETTKPKPKPKPKPEPKKSGNIPASQRPSDYRQGQVYGTDSRSHGRNWSNPHGQVSNKPSEGDRSTWGTKPKPKPKPKPEPTRTRSSGSTTRPTTTTTRTSPTPATSSNGQSLRQGRTPPKSTNKPKPAGKVYGSTGRKDLKQSARMADALKTLKVRDYPGSKKKPAAKPKPAPEPKVSRPQPPSSLSKPKPAATKPTPAKPKPTPAKQKPLTVPTSQIPKNLSGAAGKKYLADLDAGKLTRKRK